MKNKGLGLTLTREVDDQIVITTTQGEIQLTVVWVGGKRVKLAIKAPEEMLILRKELVSEVK